jgi:hypothetical protein
VSAPGGDLKTREAVTEWLAAEKAREAAFEAVVDAGLAGGMTWAQVELVAAAIEREGREVER